MHFIEKILLKELLQPGGKKLRKKIITCDMLLSVMGLPTAQIPCRRALYDHN
jgi:hypothetical protein